ncbi:putative hydrolase of the HAD superfamily [Sporomusaceae bacterium BoRhaA]|uniref:HAD family hydrolase n=1 Tax=Pelorhabdus rhamnosifermentans TaxID=2772457 RepID=UPI001C05FE6B|nr:HAD family hydrolase [Pelorhabdus rhamnosifermentans]MBU2703718.1 putative hydrolase of the HAD superfamily [Pelorhabdus rhamnosifermentans]
MIKAILFDIDGTMIDNYDAENKALYQIHRKHQLNGMPVDAFIEEWHKQSEHHFERYLAGELDFDTQRILRVQAVFDKFGQNIPKNEVEPLFQEYLAEYESNWCLYNDVMSCLESLRGYLLGVVSNGDLAQQQRKLNNTGIINEFLSILISGDFGIAKPQPAIFEACLTQLGVSKEEAIYVGDSVEKDMVGAMNAGIRGILIDRGDHQRSLLPDQVSVVNSLDEVKDVISRL